MKVKETIVKNIIEEISSIFADEQLQEIKNAIAKELNKYKIENESTEISLTESLSVQLLKKFLLTKKMEGLSDGTLKRYAEQNYKMIYEINKDLNEVTTDDIRMYMTILKTKNNLTNTSLDGMRRCWSTFYGWLNSEGYIRRNPCLAIKKVKTVKEIKKPFADNEIKQIKQACNKTIYKERNVALVDFLNSTGCRVSEVQGINIKDINFEKKECIVLGKGKKERFVYLNDESVLSLKKYLSTRTDTSVALFTGRGGNRITKSGIEQMLKTLEKQSNVVNVHPHRYRRTLASKMAEEGMDIQKIAILLGHSNIQTTTLYCNIKQNQVKSEYMRIMDTSIKV